MAAGWTALRKIDLGSIFVACGLALIFSVHPMTAHADAGRQPIIDALSVGPSACLDRKALAAHIEIWLQQSELDRRLTFAVTDTPEGARFVVRRAGVILGERLLRLKDVPCPEMTAAVGLGIATAIDATILADLAARPPPEASVTVAVDGAVLVRVLAALTPALTAAVDWSFGRRASVRASALVTASTNVTVGSGGADVSLVAGRLDSCLASVGGSERVGIRGCLGALAGAVQAHGAGFPSTSATTVPWLAPALRLEARWALARSVGLELAVDGFVPIIKPALQVVDASSRQIVATYSFPVAGLGASIGPWLRF
jgi:hypothetical protein